MAAARGARPALVKASIERSRLLAWGLQGAALVAVFVAVTAFQTRNMLATDRQPAPQLAGPTLAGDLFGLDPERDRPMLVYFFAPWCRICGASADNVERLRRFVGEGDLDIVTVALDWADAGEVGAYAEKHGLPGPIVLGDRRIATDWRIYAYPTYYVLDSEHRIARRDIGYSTQLGLLLRIWSVD